MTITSERICLSAIRLRGPPLRGNSSDSIYLRTGSYHVIAFTDIRFVPDISVIFMHTGCVYIIWENGTCDAPRSAHTAIIRWIRSLVIDSKNGPFSVRKSVTSISVTLVKEATETFLTVRIDSTRERSIVNQLCECVVNF